MKITNKPGAFDVDVKRFHAPACIEMNCPACGEPSILDFCESYLSYPRANVPSTEHMYCNECDHEWPVTFVLRIQLEAAPEAD